MKYLVTGKEMKLLDKNTSEHFHVPELVLMEQASIGFVQELFSIGNKFKRAYIVAGIGNNGGDGIAIARLLYQRGIDVSVFLIENLEKGHNCSSSYQMQKQIYQSYGLHISDSLNEACEYDIVIDAIFGTGLSRNVSGIYEAVINEINAVNTIKVAVDIPSGISSDDGSVLGCAVKADYTITFAFYKVGQFLWPATEYCGQILLANMGITSDSFLDKKPKLSFYEKEDLSLLPKRSDHSNKGTYGKLLVIAGSRNMAGACIFAAKAAYKCGVGLVKIYTCEENRVIIQQAVPESILVTYEKNYDKQSLIDALKWADAVVLGPGIGTGNSAKGIVDTTLTNVTVPMVVDADALNIISENTERLLRPHMDLILTPHLGEMSRLTGDAVSFIQSTIVDSARDFAQKYDLICVLKDFHTITAVPYAMTYVNLSGNNGMATAGSGDVLSGIIGALLAQNIGSELAASMGVYVHGLAGDAAMNQKSRASMIASDIIDGLDIVWQQI